MINRLEDDKKKGMDSFTEAEGQVRDSVHLLLLLPRVSLLLVFQLLLLPHR